MEKFTTVIFLSILTSCLVSTTVHAQSTSVASPITETRIAIPKPNKESDATKYKFHVDALAWARQTHDQFNKSAGSHTDIAPRLDVIYNSWLTFDLQIEVYFVSGNSKSFYTEEGKSTAALFLDEAAVNIYPLSDNNLQFRAGALYVTLNPIQSIMSDMGFLGASQNWDLKIPGTNLTMTLNAIETVPSSGTVTHGLINDSPDAFYMAQSLIATLDAKNLSSVFKIGTTHYEFGNLSSNVASDSVLIGNSRQSFEGIGPNTKFIIGFGGFETAASVATELSKRLKTELTGSYIKNDQTLTEGNAGYVGKLETTVKLNRFNLIPVFKVFNMGADVTPATYTITPYRFHNREGYAAMMKFELPKEQLKFFVGYTNGAVKTPNPTMADREMYEIGVEAKYDIL